MESNGIVNKIFTFLDEHQWISFFIGTAAILITAYVALRFGHEMSSLLGVILRWSGLLARDNTSAWCNYDIARRRVGIVVGCVDILPVAPVTAEADGKSISSA